MNVDDGPMASGPLPSAVRAREVPPRPTAASEDRRVLSVSRRHPVVFVSSVFDEVDTGPGTYAQYLWDYFRKSASYHFYLVAPTVMSDDDVIRVVAPTTAVRALVYGRLRSSAWAALRSSTDEGAAILHVNNSFVLGQLGKYRGPIVVQVNDYEVAQWRTSVWRKLRARDPRGAVSMLLRRRGEARAVRAASRVVCNSNATAAAVRSAYGVSADKTVVIYKAVNLDWFSKTDSSPVVDPWPQAFGRGFRLVFVGTNWHVKGLDVLLRAVATLHRDAPTLHIAVIGTLSRRNGRFVQLARDLGVHEAVHFVGRVEREDLPMWLWSSDLAVAPSRAEALGVAALEAMAAGLPVVASRVGGLAEIVDSSNGALVQPEDPRDLHDAIALFLSNPDKLSESGSSALRSAARFSHLRMLQEVQSLYDDLRSGPTS